MSTLESSAPTLATYVGVLRRRKFLVIGTAAIVTAVAVIVSLQQTKIYSASADVLLSRQSGLASVLLQTTDPTLSTDPIRVAATQTGVARLPEVAQRAVKNIPTRSADGLLANSSVSSSADSDILTLTANDRNPAMAVRLANAYATAYTSYSLELATTTLRNARLDLQGRMDALQKQGQQKSAAYQALQANVLRLQTMELLQNPSTVVNRATDAVKVKPTPKRSGLLAAVFGLVIGCALAFLWEALDKRVKTEEEIGELLGLPMLSRMPPPTRQLSTGHRLAMLDEPHDVQAEAVRRLRVNIEFANLEADAHTIMITSSVQQEGKSTTIANLAIALARAGHNVALVDLDLRRPALASFFGITRNVGITDVALGRLALEEALVPVRIGGTSASNGAALRQRIHEQSNPKSARNDPAARNGAGNLVVLPAGELPADPGEFVGTTALQRVIAALRASHELVLIDSPPICVVGDAMILSAHVDALVVVARLGLVDRATLDDLARELTASPATKLGYVLTGVDRNDHYGKSSYYGHHGRKPAEPKPGKRRGTTAAA
jgi:Mrp family chromosome partitioning ATPase/capsular polysaccharide biosynthesis protein